MKVLIVAATYFEIEAVSQAKTNAEFLITGVGIPATIFHLTKKLLATKYDLVINAGIAGAFNSQFNLADVVLVQKDTFGDIGISEEDNFKTLFESGFENENEFPFTNGWLKNDSLHAPQYSLPSVKGVTVNKITDDRIQVEKLREKFSADIESMEGAAFHYVCLQQKINFLQLRSLSNKTGERDKSKWQLKEAIINLNKELFKIIEKERL